MSFFSHISQFIKSEKELSFLYIAVFFFPFWINISSYFIGFYCLITIYRLIKKGVFLEWNFIGALCLSFFGIHLLSVIYTENINAAFGSIESKISLLVFPVFLQANTIRNIKIQAVFISFLYGLIGYFTYSLLISIYYYTQTHDSFEFFRSGISRTLHQSYLSVYINLVIVYFGLTLGNIRKKENLFILIFLGVLVVYLFLLTSKIGLLLFFISLVFIVYFKTTHFSLMKKLGAIALLLICFVLVIFSSEKISSRFTGAYFDAKNYIQQKETQKSGSVIARTNSFQASIEIAKNHFWTGVGTGDVKDELASYYLKNKRLEEATKKLDSHNQYLQNWVSTGVFGFVLGLLILVYPFFIGLIERNQMLFFLGLEFSILSLVESTFEVQTGLVVFLFFLFILKNYKTSATTKTLPPI